MTKTKTDHKIQNHKITNSQITNHKITKIKSQNFRIYISVRRSGSEAVWSFLSFGRLVDYSIVLEYRARLVWTWLPQFLTHSLIHCSLIFEPANVNCASQSMILLTFVGVPSPYAMFNKVLYMILTSMQPRNPLRALNNERTNERTFKSQKSKPNTH